MAATAANPRMDRAIIVSPCFNARRFCGLSYVFGWLVTPSQSSA
jgi:hypothetical protein